MDARLAFWTFALGLMLVMMLSGLNGWRQIRRGDVASHRRSMHVAITLFFTFILSYLLKLRFIGREDFSQWSDMDINILRIHETFVLILFLAGLVARWLARRLDGPTKATSESRREVAPRHRWAGRIALVSGIMALLTAGLVLAGMYRRTTESAQIPAPPPVEIVAESR